MQYIQLGQHLLSRKPAKKLRRGIRAKTRTVSSLIYEPGDRVYFKQENSNLWKGPHTVIGRENKQILVKYGETYLRAHAC